MGGVKVVRFLGIQPAITISTAIQGDDHHESRTKGLFQRQFCDRRGTLPLSAELFDKLEFIKRGAGSKARTLMQHALIELLEQPAVVSLVAGVKKPEQLSDWISAVDQNT